MREAIIGIIGGMGPAATAKFYSDLVARTPAERDQDHYHVIIDSNVKIPDRTAFLAVDGQSPQEALIKTARRLERAGVTVGCIPCMTAHYFYGAIAAAVNYPIIHAMAEVDNFLKTKYRTVQRVGLLCTDGTRKMKLFDKHLQDFELLYPSADEQERVMSAIYGPDGIKAGGGDQAVKLLAAVAAGLVAVGAQVIVAGCTEIPLALKQEHVKVPLIDALSVVIDTLLTYR